MKLREFELDAPEAPKAERLKFRSESRTVTALFERCFEGLDVPNGWKVLLECVANVSRCEVRNLLNVLTMQVPFDIELLADLDTLAKKEAILNAFQSGVLAMADIEGWPLGPFKKAHKAVLERKIVNEWWWRKKKWNPNRKLCGQLWCTHDMDAFRGWLVIRDKAGDEITRKKVIDISPLEFAFVPLLGKTKWVSEHRFLLLAKDNSEVGCLNVPQAPCPSRIG